MEKLFEELVIADNENFLDDGQHPEEILGVIYFLNHQLKRVTLSEEAYVKTEGTYRFQGSKDGITVNGTPLEAGINHFDEQTFLVLLAKNLKTHFLLIGKTVLDISNSKDANISTYGKCEVLLDHTQHDSPKVLVRPHNENVYFNTEKIETARLFEVNIGDRLLTEHYLLERRKYQWKITDFNKGKTNSLEFNFDLNDILPQKRKAEKPRDYPDYRRSPRLNLETPEGTFKVQKIEETGKVVKGGILKIILAPIGTLGVGALVTLLSGRSPLMMLGTAIAGIMATAFTVTQYRTEKKEQGNAGAIIEEDYQYYLVKTISDIRFIYDKEKEVLNFKHLNPELILEKMVQYDSRIYERMRNNKDFLEISLGTGKRKSDIKIETDYTIRDEDEWAKHVKALVHYFSWQQDVPQVLELQNQTIGLVGTYETFKNQVSNILLQLAFFHSYRDVNFIQLVPEKSYKVDWEVWRFLPHFNIQELNMRGMIRNAQTRDMILNSFYQILNKRKTELNEAGREQPVFLPHYVFTIFEDSYLAGHGINEFLAEDLSALGVTVIWCKEDQKLLPETVTALIDVKNQGTGLLINDHNVYVEKQFTPYAPFENQTLLENSLRKLSNLNHVEIEKNAVPEQLSLLDQYEVKDIAELDIPRRWKEAEPNKSIRSLIGWRGKGDYSYWDLHERAHGPHALVGGTTGSGKSEFLTTYLIGLAINFSPEDVGMLIIDWKGGGIANTLDKLPHFMGAITNLDGAGTARALASIKAELDKRQREFAKYGVNNINGYMSLYKERHEAKDGVDYPEKPLPHLILVSDEFAELKSNVPEFLDELTSVARIGRSLGVHLILATQKPSGVVNDQIEANSKSKIALKMASPQDSNELLKTEDAAHITNPGRGYLKVGQNEVYELFQSGYAGVPYNPTATHEVKQDERIYEINDWGQYEIFYDPGEEIKQDKSKKDLPTQLEAVIDNIVEVFEGSTLLKPDQPWLPNLDAKIVTPKGSHKKQRDLKIPLGILDIPNQQAQETYHYDLEKTSHTAVFSSPGYGKSTLLQTLVMNLSRQNTPEQVQFNLLDFGTNGLLPLKDLPHVADLVALEEVEKLQKMLERISATLITRKSLFKKAGVASLSQYEAKTKEQLPVIVTILDSYDGLTQQDVRKDGVDNLLLLLLREGAALGLYLVMSAGRVGAVRMNMMANIQTKIAFYLNDESELVSIMGRERLTQVELAGRGQLTTTVPTAIQIYLPASGKNVTEMLESLSSDVQKLNETWKGIRPEAIPMTPEKLYLNKFDLISEVSQWQNEQKIPFGMSYQTTNILGFVPKFQPYFLFAPMDDEQNLLFQQILIHQISKIKTNVLLVDFNESFEEITSNQKLSENITLVTDKEDAVAISKGMVGYVQLLKKKETGKPMLLVIANLQDFIQKTGISTSNFVLLLKNTYKAGLDILIFSPHEYIAKSFDEVPKAIRQLKFTGLVGSRIYDSPLLKGNGVSSEPELATQDAYFVLRGGSSFDKIKLPQIGKGEQDG